MTGCPRSGSGCTGLQSTGGALINGPATMHRPYGQGGLAPGKSAIDVGAAVIKGATEDATTWLSRRVDKDSCCCLDLQPPNQVLRDMLCSRPLNRSGVLSIVFEVIAKWVDLGMEEFADLRKKEELLREKEELLRKKENFLLGKAVREPLQMDEVSHVLNLRPMFATVRVINDRKNPPIELETEVLVDFGCAPELILPKRKFQQLQLGIMDITHARGYGGAVTEMIVYRSVRVDVDLTDAVTGEVLETKSADLVPHSKSSDLDWVPSDGHEFAGFHGQLSPIKRSSGIHDPPGLLGFAGLRKLGLQVDPENYHLLRATEHLLQSAMKGKKRKGADEPKQPKPKVPKPKPKDKPDTVGWVGPVSPQGRACKARLKEAASSRIQFVKCFLKGFNMSRNKVKNKIVAHLRLRIGIHHKQRKFASLVVL
ncbi:hypothetical protein HaLaN_28842, partial [Haematococcus lacustris]